MAPFTFDSPASLMQIPRAVNPSMLYDTVCHCPEWGKKLLTILLSFTDLFLFQIIVGTQQAEDRRKGNSLDSSAWIKPSFTNHTCQPVCFLISLQISSCWWNTIHNKTPSKYTRNESNLFSDQIDNNENTVLFSISLNTYYVRQTLLWVVALQTSKLL